MDDFKPIKVITDTGSYTITKEVLKDAVEKYEIRIEA
jgi:hypothetical protein